MTQSTEYLQKEEFVRLDVQMWSSYCACIHKPEPYRVVHFWCPIKIPP